VISYRIPTNIAWASNGWHYFSAKDESVAMDYHRSVYPSSTATLENLQAQTAGGEWIFVTDALAFEEKLRRDGFR